MYRTLFCKLNFIRSRISTYYLFIYPFAQPLSRTYIHILILFTFSCIISFFFLFHYFYDLIFSLPVTSTQQKDIIQTKINFRNRSQNTHTHAHTAFLDRLYTPMAGIKSRIRTYASVSVRIYYFQVYSVLNFSCK